MNHYLDKLSEKMLNSKRNIFKLRLIMLQKIAVKQVGFSFRKWKSIESPKLGKMVLLKNQSRQKSILVLISMSQRRKLNSMGQLSAQKTSNAF